MASDYQNIAKAVARHVVRVSIDALVLDSWVTVAKLQRLQHLRTQARRKGRPGWRHQPVMSMAQINRVARRLQYLNEKRNAIESERVSELCLMVLRTHPQFHGGGMVSHDRAFGPIIDRGTEYLVPPQRLETKELRIETKELRTIGDPEVLTVHRAAASPSSDQAAERVAPDAGDLSYYVPGKCTCVYATEVRPDVVGVRTDVRPPVPGTIRVVVGVKKCASCLHLEKVLAQAPPRHETFAHEGVGRSPPSIGPRRPIRFRMMPGTRMQIGGTWFVAVTRPDGTTSMVRESKEPQ